MNPNIIVAVDCDGGFGKEGKIPWHFPEDLAHFKKLTSGHVCVMGRNTYEEILLARLYRDKINQMDFSSDILRGRESYVVTNRKEFIAPGATIVPNLGSVVTKMTLNNDQRKLFVIGGRRMFIEALSTANEIYMTILKGNKYDCDVFFPVDVLTKKFKIISGEETDKAYFVVYNRK